MLPKVFHRGQVVPLKDHSLGRPSTVSFSDTLQVGYTFTSREYDRRPEMWVPMSRAMVRRVARELNLVKREMEIHEESRYMTKYYTDV